jgi:hypothetical protein
MPTRKGALFPCRTVGLFAPVGATQRKPSRVQRCTTLAPLHYSRRSLLICQPGGLSKAWAKWRSSQVRLPYESTSRLTCSAPSSCICDACDFLLADVFLMRDDRLQHEGRDSIMHGPAYAGGGGVSGRNLALHLEGCGGYDVIYAVARRPITFGTDTVRQRKLQPPTCSA